MIIESIHIRSEMGSIGRNIRISATKTVIEALGRVNIDLKLRIVWIRQIRRLEVLLHSSILIRRLGEVVRKSTRSTEVAFGSAEINVHDALAVVDGLVAIQHGATHGGDIGTVGRVLGVEDLALWAETAVLVAVTGKRCDAVVARREEDGVAL